MDNFIFSINATLPVFFVILVGYFLKRKEMINENFVLVSNDLNFKITLPALLFQDIASARIKEGFDIKYVVYCMIVTSICFWGIWGCTKIWMKDKRMIGAFVQASFRGSAAVLGVAFIQTMYGNSGAAPLMIVGAVPLYNIYSVLVLTFESEDVKGRNTKNALLNVCKNPIIISILVGLLASYIGIYEKAPAVLTKTVSSVAGLATPLALLTIGASFEGRKAIAKIKPTLVASFIKLILIPALFLPFAIMLGFRDQKMIAILIMLGAPTTVSCYIMAKSMKNDGVLTSSVVVFTTLLSSISLTGWIFILRSLGLIS